VNKNEAEGPGERKCKEKTDTKRKANPNMSPLPHALKKD
jgi:hypothetical protein